jgi:hypothetical protein
MRRHRVTEVSSEDTSRTMRLFGQLPPIRGLMRPASSELVPTGAAQ